MERAAVDHIQQLISDEVTKRFPDTEIVQVSVLQYGDEPVVEPGELLVRIRIAAPEDEAGHERALDAFRGAHREAIERFRDELMRRLPEAGRLEFLAGGEGDQGVFLRIMLRASRSLESRALAGGELTPVMARLAPADLETLDTLITAGIAPNRADAVRWAIARIRERPAYGKLRDRAREIEELKAQF